MVLVVCEVDVVGGFEGLMVLECCTWCWGLDGAGGLMVLGCRTWCWGLDGAGVPHMVLGA